MRMIANFNVWIAIMAMVVIGASGYAEEANPTDTAELKKQIELLQKRVDQLEAERKNATGGLGRPFSTPGARWDPFEEIQHMQQRMNQMFQNSFNYSGSAPGVFSSQMNFNADPDFKETPNGYEIRFDMNGLNKEKVDIQINEHSITVKGEQSQQNTQEGAGQYSSFQSFGSFMKTIPLPIDADTSKLSTEKEGDTLVIKLPKKDL